MNLNPIKSILDLNDIGLSSASYDLFFLREHLDNIEKEIARLSSVAEADRDRELKELRLKDFERDELEGQRQLIDSFYNGKVDVRLPLMFRGTFIIMLYAVYEVSITEVAHVLQKRCSLSLSIDDIREGFLDRARKYFEQVLEMGLCPSTTTWQAIRMLAEIRNGYAHANGRLEMMGKRLSERIKNYAKNNTGEINTGNGYVIVSSSFTRTALETVSSSIDDLIERALQSPVPPASLPIRVSVGRRP